MARFYRRRGRKRSYGYGTGFRTKNFNRSNRRAIAYGLYRNQAYMSMIPSRKYNQNTIHYFKRKMRIAASSDTPVDVKPDAIYHGVLYFSLGQIPNFAEFTALYDQYRIVGVKVKFTFTRNNVATAGGGSNQNPNFRLLTVIDYDDKVKLTAETDYYQYQNNKNYVADKLASTGISRFFRPKTAAPVFQSGVTTAYGSNSPWKWLDCAYDAIEYYGLKYAFDATIDGSGTASLGQIVPEVTYYLQCRAVR